ncbi:quinon protein alcohol dehydrogenase-like superfamily [Dunaliella salina]|uniref:Quinon protein alcohol dehydrogenase-like superfamily n=1 Tax=Dunaliella salina TaxID=3046 RepID=A0ABQ7G885_DUNSA|nr:quinon protein alcohol dehydrogenase-like superfamily [Dunaliella salina]|eukprot:KAF5830814.1 quinon protein alcohol dehydrogenase-like superfamily [Dunaliella salina]
MVLCLAKQLAEQLPGFPELLQPIAEEYGGAHQLTMKETFEKYLLEPLTELDKKREPGQPVVVMLLDAMDEATDGAAGHEPVTQLVGKEMSKLPCWVKIILTGRPHMEMSFRAWMPYLAKIDTSSSENMNDFRKLLESRLKSYDGIVSAADFPAALDVLLRKGQGQFIWSKFAFSQLCSREGRWTPAEMKKEELLPSGLDGMFHHVLGEVQDALRKEKPDALVLLREQLLPILVAAKSPLSPQQLAVMIGVEQDQVDFLLRLLVDMFPLQERNGTLRVVAYHKSVLDWLTNPTRSTDLFVDSGRGNQHAGMACFNAVKGAGVSLTGPPPSRETTLEEDVCLGPLVQRPGSILLYSLRFGLAHLCLAHSYSGSLESLEALILDFCGFWPMVFKQGIGADVVRDLIAYAPETSEVVKDVIRWLKTTGSYLTTYPRAALQLACDAPRNSLVARHANSLPELPQARLVNKEDDWNACVSVLTGHSDEVTSVAMSADTAVSGSSNTIRVWDLNSCSCKDTHRHTGRVNCVAITSDARVCVFGSGDHTLRVLDLEAQVCRRTLSGHTHAVNSLAISPDSHLCVSGSTDKTLRVWDLSSGRCKKTLSGHTGGVTSVAISTRAHVCASGSEDQTIRIWDLLETVEDSKACKRTLQGHMASVWCVDVNPDASLCVSGSADGTLRFWDLNSGACKAILHHQLRAFLYQVSGVRMSPDARFCVSASWDKLLRVWDLVEAEKGQKGCTACKAVMEGHSDYVSSVAISSDARSCVSGALDHTLRIWSLDGIGTRKEPQSGHTGRVNEVASTLDGRTCVSCSDDYTLRVWDLQSGACKHTLLGHRAEVWSVAISSDACTCVSASADKTLRVWDLGSGACKRTLSGHTYHVFHVAISTDARFCVSGSGDATLRVWDLATGDCKHTLSGHTRSITCMAMSSDDSLCVSASADHTLRVWELASGACKKTLPGVGFVNKNGVCISPDSRLCVAASNTGVREFDLSGSTGEQLDCCKFDSPGGQRLLALADSWRAERQDCGPRANVAVLATDNKQVIQWKSASAGSTSMANPVAFLIPPMCVKFGPFYEEGSRKVRFFDGASNQLVCYQLLALSSSSS